MVRTRASVEASSSVTVLACRFATQTWVPSALMESGSEKPQPKTFGPGRLAGLADIRYLAACACACALAAEAMAGDAAIARPQPAAAASPDLVSRASRAPIETVLLLVDSIMN